MCLGLQLYTDFQHCNKYKFKKSPKRSIIIDATDQYMATTQFLQHEILRSLSNTTCDAQ